MIDIPDNFSYKCCGWLFIQYKLLKKSGINIAKECNKSPETIYKWIRKFKFIKNKHPINSTSFKKGHLPWNKNLTKETNEKLKKIGELHKGKTWNLTEETKKRMSISRLNDANGRWRGDKAGYTSIHIWITKNKPKPLDSKCEICRKIKKLELSSKTHEYKRDIDEYQWACRSCHMNYDIKNNLRGKKYDN